MTESLHDKAGGMIARLWSELVVAGRFGIVGIAATSLHVGVVWLLIETTVLPVLVANFVAFLTAFSVSFAGNYFWTFCAPGNPGRAMRRFFLISLSAIVANTSLLAGLVHTGWFSPVTSAITAATIIPLTTFLASRLWIFQGPKERSNAETKELCR